MKASSQPTKSPSSEPTTKILTPETITDEQIHELRNGTVDDSALAHVCRIALQHGEPTGLHPFCRVCSWRKGGVDSWDGKACKCKLRAPMHHLCDRCAGVGSIPENIGSTACPSCDGSGLVDINEIYAARARCAEMLNARSAK